MEEFLRTVQGRAYRMAEIATSNGDEALDLVQDAMYDFVRRYRHYHSEQWRPLFYRVLQNKIRDWYRRTALRRRFRGWLSWRGKSAETRQEDPFAQVADTSSTNPANHMEINASMDRLRDELASLPPKQQQVFLMRAWEGFSTKETAAIMNCSPGTVKTHYWRALNTLQTQMKDYRP